MPIVIRYSLNRQSTIHDLTERAEFFQSLTDNSTPMLVDRQVKTHLASKAILEALARKTRHLNSEIKLSAAFVALEQNLIEYVNNSIDANATQITITICDVIRHSNVIIHYHDNGDPFKPSMLSKDQSSRDYNELIDHASHFPSTKEQERLAGKKHLLGGMGLGLSFTSRFLKEHGGKLLIGTSPKLIIRSTPYIDLRKAFRETQHEAFTRLACDEGGHDINQQTDFSAIEEYGQTKEKIEERPKNRPSAGLKLNITAKINGSLSSNDKSSASDQSTRSRHSSDRFFATPRSHSSSSVSTPAQTPIPQLIL